MEPLTDPVAVDPVARLREELVAVAHRAYVMHRGRLRAELAGAELTEAAVLAHFFDVSTPAAAGDGAAPVLAEPTAAAPPGGTERWG